MKKSFAKKANRPSTKNVEKPAVRLPTEFITFIERAYWIVGVATLYWFLPAVGGVYRITEVGLPFLGPCKPSETIIFTLLFLWVPLLALHLLTRAYQRRTDGSFPGVLGDKLEIPRALRELRWLVFFALVVFPTGSYVLFTVRAFTHLLIVWKPEVDSHPWDSGKWPSARNRLGMFRFSSPPDGSKGWIFHGDWRWKHQAEEWREELVFYPRGSQSENTEKRYEAIGGGAWRERILTTPQSGKDAPSTTWIETNDAGTATPITLVELQRPAPLFLQKNTDGTFAERTLLKASDWDEPVMDKKFVRVWISAWPGLQPLLFAGASSGLLLLLMQHVVRGWRGMRRELLPAPQAKPADATAASAAVAELPAKCHPNAEGRSQS